MVFRGQNYLSGALRRVGRDVGALSRGQQLSTQNAQLNINKRRVQQQLALNLAERQSILYGSRRYALDQAAYKLGASGQTSINKLRTIQEGQLRNQSNLLKSNIRLEQLATAGATGRPVGRGLSKMSPEQIKRAFQAEYVANQALLEQQVTLERQREAQVSAISQQSVATQQLASREVELYEREAQLTQIMATRAKSIDLIDEKLAQNAIAMRALPWERFQTGARYIEHAGRVLQMFGLIGTATFGYFAKAAADFTTQATIAATQATVAGRNTVANVRRVGKELSTAITGLLTSGQTTARPDELTKAAYSIFSGITLKGNQKAQIKEGIGILKQFNQVLTANYGMVSFDEVTQAGILIINNFDRNLKHLPKDLNTMQAAVRFGRLTMSEFVGTLGQVAPAAHTAGLSFTQAAEAMAFLSRSLPVRMASAGFARLTELLLKNADAFKKVGIQVEKPGGGLRDIRDIVRDIIAKNPGLATGRQSVIAYLKAVTGSQSTIQARRVLSQYLHDLSLADTISKQVRGDTNELVKSAIASGTSPGVAWAKFINQLRGIILLIGKGAIPAFAALGKPIAAIVKWFTNLSPHTQRLIGYVGTLVVAFSLLGGTILAIVGGLASLVIGMRLLAGFARGGVGFLGLGFGKSIAGNTAQLSLFRNEVGAATAAMGLRLGIPAVIVAMILWHKQTMAVINALGGLKAIFLIVGSVMATLTFAKLAVWLFNAAKAAYLYAAALGTVAAEQETVAATNPFLLLVVAASVAGVEIALHWDAIKRAFERAINAMYKFFINHFVNPIIAAINDMSAAWNLLFGWALGNLGKINQVASKNIFDTSGWHMTGGNRWRWANHPYKNFFEQYERAAAKHISTLKTQQEREKAAAQAAREYFKKLGIGTQTPSVYQKMARDILKMVSPLTTITALHDRATRAARRYGTTATQSFQKAYQAYVKAALIAKRDPTDIKKQLAAEEALAKLKAVANQQQLAAAQKAADAIVAQNGKIGQSTKATFQDVLQGLQSMFDNFLQQEQQNFGELFQGPWMQSPMYQTMQQWGHRTRGADVTKDLRQQIGQYRSFNRLLAQLARRGAPQALIDQLRQLGPAAIAQVRALASMTAPELRNYFRMFRTAQRLIHQQTMRDLNRQLKDYMKYGKNIAMQIVAGLKSENQSLEKALTAMIKRVFGQTGVTTQHHRARHARQRHRQMGGTVQRYMPYIVGESGEELFVPNQSGRIINSGQTNKLMLNPAWGGKGDTYHYSPTIQVTARDDSSATTQARHAEFAIRQKWNDFRRH